MCFERLLLEQFRHSLASHNRYLTAVRLVVHHAHEGLARSVGAMQEVRLQLVDVLAFLDLALLFVE